MAVSTMLHRFRRTFFLVLAAWVLLSALHYPSLHVHADAAEPQMAVHLPIEAPAGPEERALQEPAASEVHCHPAGMLAGSDAPLRASQASDSWLFMQAAVKDCHGGLPERPPRLVV
jgi:hypothetical protein